MKEKYLPCKYLLLIIILFTCLFIFSTPSFALIPGDFNGDGQVGFPDLIIFALAYNTTPSDPKWNPVCDLDSNNIIGFGDLIIFAMHYGEEVVTGVQITPITRQVSTGLTPQEMSSFEEENNSLMDYRITNINEGLKGETVNSIDVSWHSYPDATGYKVYRSVNGGNYTIILDWQAPSGSDWYVDYDYDVSEGNTYSYYVTAYGADWETSPSEIVTIEITAYTFWPACSLLTSPTDGSTITEINPIFSWSPVGLDASGLPYGEIYSGETYLRIYDASTYETAWLVVFDDMTTSTATYDQNGSADPLISGNTYRWYVVTNGYNNNGFYVSSSFSETWEFNYGNVVFQVDAVAYTFQSTRMEMLQQKIEELKDEGKIQDSYQLNEVSLSGRGITQHGIGLEWHSYPDAIGYNVYRSINSGGPTLIFWDEPTEYEDWYWFWDEAVSEGNTYTYYVTAYGSGWETDRNPEVTIDTWLPPCSLISPADQSVITDPAPTFTWNPVGVSSFPYVSIVSGYSVLWISNITDEELAWHPYFDNLTISSATYNQDGQATPLTAGHGYEWEIVSYGYDENGKLIAYSLSEYWDFSYTGP